MGKRLNVSRRPQKFRSPIELSGFSTEPSWDTVEVTINGSMFLGPEDVDDHAGAEQRNQESEVANRTFGMFS
jgi:hypothetical protein